MRGFFTKRNTEAKKKLKEFRVKNIENYKEGNEFGLEIFKDVKFVDVRSTTIGKGFIATFTSPTTTFPGIVTSGNYVKYTRDGKTDPSFAKVDQVNTNSIILSGVLSGVQRLNLIPLRDGKYPTTQRLDGGTG